MRMQPDSGTKDENYDLITVTQLCLEHVWRLDQYAHDAEQGGDDQLATLFRRMQEHSRRGADECKQLLRQRIGEEARGYRPGGERRYRGEEYSERRPSGVGFSGYDTSGTWDRPAVRQYGDDPYDTRSSGRYAGKGPKGWTGSRERIVERVSERLTDHPDIDASEIQVDVENDLVFLRGRVADRSQKRLAEDIAASVSSVRDVRNELDVDKGMLQELTEAITGRSDDDARSATTRRTRQRSGV